MLRGAGDLAHRLARERLELLAGPGHPDPQVAEPGRPARAGRPPAARCRSAGSGARPPRAARPTRRTPRSAPSSPHVAQASSRARPFRLSTQTTRPGARRRSTKRSENRPPWWGRRGAGRPPRRGPAPPLLGPARDEEVAPVEGLERRARRHQHARQAGPPGPLDGDVAGVPGRGLLVLVAPRRARRAPPPGRGRGIGAQAPARAPTTVTPPAAARAHSPAAAAPGRSWARQATGWPARREAGRQRAGPRSTDGHSTSASPSGSAAAASTSGYRSAAGRQPQHAPRPAQRVGQERVVERLGDRVDRCRRIGQGPHRARAATRSRNEAGRPAQRHAAQRARSTSSAGGPQPVTLASGLQVDPRRRARRRRRRPSRRPAGRAAATRTIVPTRTRSSQPSGTR